LTAAEWREIELAWFNVRGFSTHCLRISTERSACWWTVTIPAELPFGHPNFLWPCHGIPETGGNRLHVYAVDISRSADGRGGARRSNPDSLRSGYALENRQIVSRVFPDLLRDLGVRSLGGFFGALRENLLRLKHDGEAPLAVVLTPGSFQ